MLVEQHLVPQLGAVQLQNLNAAQINAHYAKLLARVGCTAQAASPPIPCTTSMPSCIGPCVTP